LWRDPDDVSHCRILSPDKTEWQLILATLHGWRRCFVADQFVHDTHTRRRRRPPVRLSTVGKRAFPVAGANMNDLPFHITSAQSHTVFRQRVKTFLFSRSYPDILIWLTYHYWLLSLFFFFSGISCGPCNNWHYLGHVRHVDDDDDACICLNGFK